MSKDHVDKTDKTTRRDIHETTKESREQLRDDRKANRPDTGKLSGEPAGEGVSGQSGQDRGDPNAPKVDPEAQP